MALACFYVYVFCLVLCVLVVTALVYLHFVTISNEKSEF